jgi:hypothetical protein
MKMDHAERVFKTSWFSKAARKADIGDDELCEAIREVMLGQADDLGGGVFKKRLHRNMHRSIILAKGGDFWVYAYLFAKKDLANISRQDLLAFRLQAKEYAIRSVMDMEIAVRSGELTEICDGY